MRRILITCVLLLAAIPVRAALPERGGSADPAKAADLFRIDQLRLALPDRFDLASEDDARAAAGEPYRFALPEAVALTPDNSGTWETLPDGRLLWRLRVTVPGALSLNVGFSHFGLPESGRLALYPAASPSDGFVFDAEDEADHGQLWSPVLLTDDLVVELVVDAGERGRVDLEMTSIGRGYRFFGERFEEKAGACNIDVICPEGDPWRQEIASVGVYTLGGFWKCSGAMINNTARDQRPYFLTAAHCNVSSGSDASVVIYWNFESPVCGQQGGGSLADNQSGSTLRATWGGDYTSDVALLELDDLPDQAYGVTYAGWSREDVAPASAVAIHHPTTDEKSISFENDPLTITGYDIFPDDGTHLKVEDWDLGTTEVGSSGSPLFDPNHRIVGQLHGGYASCANDLPDWYGRFTASWFGGGEVDSSLSTWLDPDDTGLMVLDTLDPEAASFSIAPETGVDFSGPATGPYSPSSATYTVISDGALPVTWSATSTADWVDVTPTGGTLDPGAQANVTVRMGSAAGDLAPGRHSATVEFVNEGGGPGDQALTVTMNVFQNSPRITALVPNPSWGPVDIEYIVGQSMDVHVRVYDVRGMLAADMGKHPATAGENTYPWTGRTLEGRALPGGVYFVELEGGGHRDRRKMVHTH